VTDNHDYYTSKVVSDPDGMYWTELEGDSRHHLSNAHYLKYSVISTFNLLFMSDLHITYSIYLIFYIIDHATNSPYYSIIYLHFPHTI
jgi:hypothetical protein